jgi:hypothetical protein
MREPLSVVSITKDLVGQLRDVKGPEQFTGRDSILTYRTATDELNDFSSTLEQNEVKQYRLTIQHATAIHGAMLTLNLFHGDVDVMADPNPRLFFSGAAPLYWEIETNADTYTSWIITTQSFISGTNTMYVKYFIDGTDTGIVTIDPI